MSAPTQHPKTMDRAHALVQLLRNRSYEEIRQRMYDNPPGSLWWSACKIELEIRNGEWMAEAAVETSRVVEKLLSWTQHFEQLTKPLFQAAREMSDGVRPTLEAGRVLGMS